MPVNPQDMKAAQLRSYRQTLAGYKRDYRHASSTVRMVLDSNMEDVKKKIQEKRARLANRLTPPDKAPRDELALSHRQRFHYGQEYTNWTGWKGSSDDPF
ncbi:hypothetical protein JCM10207_002002 [Rhodosporidiobolus poonsookiae]